MTGGRLNELALFAGAGGGLLATTHLLGWRTVAAVEIDPYRREVLLRRQRDGVLDLFPIWDDVRTFHGYEFEGCVDVVTAGVLCQEHSVASRGREEATDLWSHTVRIVAECKPGAVLIENVPGVRRSLPAWISDLRGLGYTVERPTTIGAASLGGPHIRDRVWLLAHSNGVELREQHWGSKREARREAEEYQRAPWWAGEPPVQGVADGVAHRVDRLGALGDGQVPAVAALAWRTLT